MMQHITKPVTVAFFSPFQPCARQHFAPYDDPRNLCYSPEVHPDRTLTLRFYAPNAHEVPLVGPTTEGNAGNGIARTGWVWWTRYSTAKTWTYREKFRLNVRKGADNLFPETRWLNAENTTVNFTSPQLFAKFPATTGYSFSNFYGQNGTLQGVLRIAL
jgi:hypothetical protein